jgi:type III secretion system chaperone SycN
MPTLDPSARSAVGQFAQSMGLTARENDDGSFGFDFDDSGRLSVMAALEGDAVLVSLRRRLVLDDLEPLARLAAAGGPDPLEGLVFQPGLTKADQAVLTVAIARRDFDLPRLDAAFLALGRAFAQQGL